MDKRIYHITSANEARAAQGSGAYAPRDFQREGFIHCSYAHQVQGVIGRRFYKAAQTSYCSKSIPLS